jgi:hypothetical protein
LRSADIFRRRTSFISWDSRVAFRIRDFGRTPGTLEIAGRALDLQQFTARSPLRLTGSAQFNGKIDIVNAKIEANLGVTADSVGFEGGMVEKVSSTLRASKTVGPIASKNPWFAELRTAMEFRNRIHYREYVVDSARTPAGLTTS